jgi:plasmid stabilization system protein ParE
VAEERREVIWTTSALNELDDIVTYIAKDAPLSALAFLEEVLNTADSLDTPHRVASNTIACITRS